MTVLTRPVFHDNEDSLSQAEQAFAYLDQTAAAMEHQTATYLELAHLVTEISTQLGDAIVGMASTMASIPDSSHRIGDVVSVIDSIAFQSNIESANALPQAAHAGKPERPLVAAAGEMYSLAGHSAATIEIKGLIDDSMEKVGIGSRLVTDAAQSLREVVSQVKRVNDLMAEITAPSQERIPGAKQLGPALAPLGEMTQEQRPKKT